MPKSGSAHSGRFTVRCCNGRRRFITGADGKPLAMLCMLCDSAGGVILPGTALAPRLVLAGGALQDWAPGEDIE